MIADLLNRRSLGSLTSLQDDSLSNFNDAFTIYGHPKVKDVLKAFELLQVIQLANYRTALKLRAIQRKMQLHRVDARDIIVVLTEANLPEPDEEMGEAEMEPLINDICLMAERNADTTIVSCGDLILTWILQLFDSNYIGAVKVKQFTTAMVIMGSGRLLDKLKYLFDTYKNEDGVLTQQRFSELLTDLLLIPCSVFEEDIYGHSNLVLNAIFECFNQVGMERQSIHFEDFLSWCIKPPFSLSWLFAFHRLMNAEYTVNLTACSYCGNAPYLGLRYVALHKYGVGICQECMWTGNCDETEFREFGALSQVVNVTVVPMKSKGSSTCITNSNTLSQVQQSLDRRHELILNYSRRLDPQSTSHFVDLYSVISTKDDNIEALVGECQDRASKLQRDFNALCNEHSEIMRMERKSEECLTSWKKRDDLTCRVAVWMSRRNDLYIKQESLLQSEKVPLPSVAYCKFGPLGSLQSFSDDDNTNNDNQIHVSLNGIDKLAPPKVSLEDSVMVLSKLSLIINNALLQKSFSSTPTKPVKRLSRDTPPLSPLSFDNRPIPRITNGASRDKIDNRCGSPKIETPDYLKLETPVSLPSETPDFKSPDVKSPDVKSPDVKSPDVKSPDVKIASPTPATPDPEVTSGTVESGKVKSGAVSVGEVDENAALTISERDAMKEIENTVNDIMIQEPSVAKEDPAPVDNISETPEDSCQAVEEEEREAVKEDDSKEEEEEEEWESEGDWETEEENTERSEPPGTLNLGLEEEERVVSEPECDPPEPTAAPPVPPPRSLLSPQGVARRATSLKTKSEGDPRMEELRKVTRASSSVHAKSKPTGIPLRVTPTIPGSSPTLSPCPTPPSRLPTPKSRYSTPDLARISDNSPRSTPDTAPKPRIAPRRGKLGKPAPPGPIVYEGESDSETSTSSSSSSEGESQFKRARSARFARNKHIAPNRNAASFRNKKSSKPKEPLEFFNSFAE